MKLMTALPLLLVAVACNGETATSPDPEGPQPEVREIELVPGSLFLAYLDQSVGVRATPRNLSGLAIHGASLEWTSEDPNVASVAGAGPHAFVTSVGDGETAIRVRSGDVSVELPVVVLQVPYEVTVTPSTVQLYLEQPTYSGGPSMQLDATVTDRGGQVCSTGLCAVTWFSADPGIAEIDAYGVVTPRAFGDTRIHAVVSACSDAMGGCLFVPVADTASVTVSPR